MWYKFALVSIEQGDCKMKSIFSKSYKAAMQESQWDYKGHQCRIELDHERNPDGSIDVTKAYHYVKMPNEQEQLADISPYDTDPKTVNMWIDAKYPRRQGAGPLNREQLQKMIGQNSFPKET